MSGTDPALEELARAAIGIGEGDAVSIPHTERTDEIGVLANALRRWQDAAAEGEILIDQLPVGVCRVDAERRMAPVNLTMARMLGYTKEELTGRSILDINPPELHARSIAAHRAFMTGKRDLYLSERQWVRKDGSLIWCSLRVAPVRPQDGGPPVSLIAISEDVTRQREQAQYAAQIQRQLLPRETLRVEGYDLAATCLPAETVGGDFYDWVLRERGQVDLTLADVMGKGMPAALVMATVRAAIRAVSPTLGPVARARVASDSLSTEITDEGMFVTLFHCRLDPESGTFRYVDAGHGYTAVRRAGGEFVPLPNRSMPLGVEPAETIRGGVARLEPGESLVIYSDGLVETEERLFDLDDFREDFDEADDAADAVRRLLSRVSATRTDDVTVVLLRRLPGAQACAGGTSSSS
jgi:PAS domain S-box-containing protein